jgi:hypothetical protein
LLEEDNKKSKKSLQKNQGRIPMVAFIGNTTKANLRQAPATSILARRRYIAFAEQADAKGGHRVAATFSSNCHSQGQSARSAINTFTHPRGPK